MVLAEEEGGGWEGGKEGGREGEWEEGGEKLKQKRKKGLRIIGMLEKTNIQIRGGGEGHIYKISFLKAMLFRFSGKPVNEAELRD